MATDPRVAASGNLEELLTVMQAVLFPGTDPVNLGAVRTELRIFLLRAYRLGYDASTDDTVNGIFGVLARFGEGK